MTTTDRPASYALDLTVEGMTCASCVVRVERTLNAIDGVRASVNLPLGWAHVEYDGPAEPARLQLDVLAAVATTGYTAHITGAGFGLTSSPEPATRAEFRPRLHRFLGRSGPKSEEGGHDHGSADGHDHGSVTEDDTPRLRDLRRRLIVSVPLAVPVVAISMIGALHFAQWQRVLLVLALPVIIWGAWPFHRAAVINARHGASTMDTLVSLGIIAATIASLRAAVTGGESYLEVAVTVSVFLLAGRYAEAGATHAGAGALRALLDLGAKDVTVLRPPTLDAAPCGPCSTSGPKTSPSCAPRRSTPRPRSFGPDPPTKPSIRGRDRAPRTR